MSRTSSLLWISFDSLRCKWGGPGPRLLLLSILFFFPHPHPFLTPDPGPQGTPGAESLVHISLPFPPLHSLFPFPPDSCLPLQPSPSLSLPSCTFLGLVFLFSAVTSPTNQLTPTNCAGCTCVCSFTYISFHLYWPQTFIRYGKKLSFQRSHLFKSNINSMFTLLIQHYMICLPFCIYI